MFFYYHNLIAKLFNHYHNCLAKSKVVIYDLIKLEVQEYENRTEPALLRWRQLPELDLLVYK